MLAKQGCMNKYQRAPDAVIDLHGHTIRESTHILLQLLEQSDVSHARVIVGKGTHSPKGPVLRDYVKDFLHSRDIRFAQSKINDGGEGALEVYLKK